MIPTTRKTAQADKMSRRSGKLSGMYRCLTLVAGVALALNALSGTAHSAKRKSLATSDFAKRPANYYSAIAEVDRNICEPILLSLNKPLTVTDNLAMSSNVTGDVLLGSDLQVPWQRKPSGADGVLDHAKIDIANDGHAMDVYRFGVLYKDIEFQNDLAIFAQSPPAWATNDEAPWETRTKFWDSALVTLDDRYKKPGLNQRIFELLRSNYEKVMLYDSFFNINILSVQGRNVLILTNAWESARALDGYPFHVFAVSYHSKENLSLVCEFRGGPSRLNRRANPRR